MIVHPPPVPWGFPVRLLDQPVVFLAVVVFPLLIVAAVVTVAVKVGRRRR